MPEIVIGLILVTLLAVVIRESWTNPADTSKVNTDLVYDYVSASEWRSGGSPYDPSQYLMEKHISPNIEFDQDAPVANPHTPFQIVMLAPLSLLGWVTAKNTWMMIDVVLLIVSVLMVCRELQFRRSTIGLAALGSAIIPLANLEFFHGQVGTLLLLLFVTGWMARRRGNDALCGIALGIAAALKLYPVLMVIPLLRSGARKAALWLLGTWAFLLGASALLIGPVATQFLDVSRNNLHTWGSAPANVSVVWLPYRVLYSVFGFDLHASIGALIAVVLGCGGLLLIYRSGGATSNDSYWACSPWIVLLSPIAWDHSLLLLLPLLILQVMSFAHPRDIGIPLRFGIAMTILGTTGVRTLLVFFVPYEILSAHTNTIGLLLGIVPMVGALIVGLYELGPHRSRSPQSVRPVASKNVRKVNLIPTATARTQDVSNGTTPE